MIMDNQTLPRGANNLVLLGSTLAGRWLPGTPPSHPSLPSPAPEMPSVGFWGIFCHINPKGWFLSASSSCQNAEIWGKQRVPAALKAMLQVVETLHKASHHQDLHGGTSPKCGLGAGGVHTGVQPLGVAAGRNGIGISPGGSEHGAGSGREGGGEDLCSPSDSSRSESCKQNWKRCTSMNSSKAKAFLSVLSGAVKKDCSEHLPLTLRP